MENVKILRVSELLHSSRAITGSSCHHLRAFSPNRHPHCPHKSNPKTLIPLEHPAILIGTLNLPSQTLKCPHKNCLQFADDGGGSSSSVSICCDILDFSVRLIGKKIHVISWNFIPLNIGGGFLEIIRWKFPDCIGTLLNQCSRVDSITLISPVNNAHYSSKFSYRVYGALESISPLTIVPCSTKSRNDNLIGFLVQIMACECEFCRSGTDLSSTTQGVDNFHCHSFIKPVFVYFCGPAWSWHPLITKLVANVVALSGLKKKMVFMGKEDSQLMFVTTEGTVLHVPRLSRKWLPPPTTNVKGNGECASYAGVVKGVYMQGMVVELEEDVWLLLTDQLLKVPHSLRVGAVISVRNVHFVNPKYSWTKILILGACFKTSVTVKSFSPLETGSNVAFRSQGLLGKFIESLAFSARMWALLVVSSFRRKFAGILSEKEILGSKHKEGLAQLYASSRLPSSVFRARVNCMGYLENYVNMTHVVVVAIRPMLA